MSIQQALVAVMNEVLAVGKNEKNAHQGFNFRGIDAVVNAVGPAFRKHQVVVMPEVLDYEYGEIEIGSARKATGHAKVKVAYTFHGPDGDSLRTVVVAESMDSGDKATAKAMSVAFRTALLQALCLPTTEPDPDASTFERSDKHEKPAKAERPKAGKPVQPVEPLAEHVAQLALADIAAAGDQARLRVLWQAASDNGILDTPLADGSTLRDAINARLKVLRGDE